MILKVDGHNVCAYLRMSLSARGLVNFASIVYQAPMWAKGPHGILRVHIHTIKGSQFSLLAGPNHSQHKPNQTKTG